MPVASLVKEPITISVCLYLPAGKSCRQMKWLLRHTHALPFLPGEPCPCPAVCVGTAHPLILTPVYQHPAADGGIGHLPGAASHAPAEAPQGGGQAEGSGSAVWASAAVTADKRCVPPPPLNPIPVQTRPAPNTSVGLLRSLGESFVSFPRHRRSPHYHSSLWGKNKLL